MLALALAVGLATGMLVSAVSHALFPNPVAAAAARPVAPVPARETAAGIALRASVVVMPNRITRITGVSGVHSSFVLRCVMDNNALPLAAY